jgi:hypothetical protein
MRGSSQNDRAATAWDRKRTAVAVITVGLFVGAGLSWAYGEESSATFATAAMTRVGLVMAALWLAWDSLKRPARWLPPGIAVAGVVALAVVAAQPRLILVAVPALGTLLALAAFIRAFKR